MENILKRIPYKLGEITIQTPLHSDIDNMRKLWEITFNDSDEYLNLIFNNHLDLRNSLTAYYDGKLVAMAIGLPYVFRINSSYTDGLYLCGLSTLPEFRGIGIMGNILSLVPEICLRHKLSFSFLIPADEHLRVYYSRFGYFNSAKRLSYIPKNGMDIISSICRLFSLSGNNISEYIYAFKSIDDILSHSNILEICINKCVEYEILKKDFHIVHTYSDWKKIFIEKLQSGSVIIVNLTPGCNSIFAVCEPDTFDIFIGTSQDAALTLQQLEIGNVGFNTEATEYGMINFNTEIFVKSDLNFKGPENSIFENNRGVAQKYEKMNFDHFSSTSVEILCRKIHFNHMLD